MIEARIRTLERKIKKIIPNFIKRIIIYLLVNKVIGRIIQKTLSVSMLGARYNFSLVGPKEAARIFFGLWESVEIRFSKRYVSDDDIVVELGSSVGVTLATLCSTKNLKKYIAVEASPTSSAILQHSVKNIPECKAIIICAAISYSNEKNVDFMETTLTGSRLYDGGDNEHMVRMHQVPAIQLKSIINKHIPRGHEYVLISDIEGAEIDIFRMDIDSLSRCKLIVCELENSGNYSIEDQVQLLRSAGFEIEEFYGQVYVLKKRRHAT